MSIKSRDRGQQSPTFIPPLHFFTWTDDTVVDGFYSPGLKWKSLAWPYTHSDKCVRYNNDPDKRDDHDYCYDDGGRCSSDTALLKGETVV